MGQGTVLGRVELRRGLGRVETLWVTGVKWVKEPPRDATEACLAHRADTDEV